jgi:hypothetical protein
MKFFVHRVNSSIELENIDQEFGIELDLRDYMQDIVVQHDPYTKGEHFKDYIQHINNRDLILNIKCERIEVDVLNILKQSKYNGNYILLDCSFPMIHFLVNNGEQNIALRFSEYEGLDTLINMKGKVKWVWVDVFNKLPLNSKICEIIQSLGYKICLVSPELQNHPNNIKIYAEEIINQKLKINAICCKIHNVQLWKQCLSL